MSTSKKVVSVVLPPELEEQIYRLRGQEEFARCSIGEIVRRFLITGLKMNGYLKDDTTRTDTEVV